MSRRSTKDATLSTRDQILDAALQVMHTVGMGRATTKEIAQAAGLSEAAMYRHFRDKSELFLCMMGERLPPMATTLRDLLSRVGCRTVRANLEDVVRVALAFYVETAPMAAALFSEPELLARYRQQLHNAGVGPHKPIDQLAAYLRAEQRGGRVAPGVNPEAAARLLIGACLQRAFISQFIGTATTPEEDTRFVKDSVRALLHGLSPRPPA
jgi:AcrR family transcriptional regulator